MSVTRYPIRFVIEAKEIESILQFNRSKKNGIRVVDLYHALNEEYGLYEAEKSVLSILDKSIVLTEHEKKRALLEGRACMTSGDVEYNPEDLRCSNCGCKYIVLYEYFCYGRKNWLFWHRCGSITSTFPYADREKPPLRILRFGNGIFRSEQYSMTM